MARDLDLYDYLVENQLPKYGLNFHFRDPESRNEKLTDYTSYMSHLIAPLPAWQIDRRSMEKDLLEMNARDGVGIFRPFRARSLERHNGGYHVEVQPVADRSSATIRAKWVIDASGRKQFLSHTLVEDNIVKEPQPNTAAFWIRVDEPDRRCFSDTVHDARTVTSPYYATNHFFGLGYWIWTIPLASGELSVGIVCDKDVVPIREVFGKKKFLDFLEREHKLVYNLCTSGEIVDCLALHHLPFRARHFYSPDRWALLGDAACFMDPFYSLGISFAAIQICQISELVKIDLVERVPPAELEQAVRNYDLHFGDNFDTTLTIFKRMYKFSDDPRAMQEKILYDQFVWFKMLVPWFVTRFFLEMRHLPTEEVVSPLRFHQTHVRLEELCAELRTSRYVPPFIETIYSSKVLESDVHECVFEFECSNPFKGIVSCYRYSIKTRLRLLFCIHGIGALTKLRQWKWIGIHLVEMVVVWFLSAQRQRRLRKEKRPHNTLLEKQGARLAGFAKRFSAQGS